MNPLKREFDLSKPEDKIRFVYLQLKQAQDHIRPFVRCGCRKTLGMHNAYKCLYCGQWYCMQCAEEHFGKTIAQYREEHPQPEVDAALVKMQKELEDL
jgi:hypothetical protein